MAPEGPHGAKIAKKTPLKSDGIRLAEWLTALYKVEDVGDAASKSPALSEMARADLEKQAMKADLVQRIEALKAQRAQDVLLEQKMSMERLRTDMERRFLEQQLQLYARLALNCSFFVMQNSFFSRTLEILK